MQRINELFLKIDIPLTNWMARHSILIMRISLGVVFVWFGVLKFFPDLSPAEELAARTIETMTFGIVQENVSLPILAGWETLIGLGLITGRFMRATLFLLFTQMIGTVMPVFLFPDEVFTRIPYAPTLEGQYIIKNLVLVSAGLVIGATVRGGQVIADPNVAEQARQRAEVRDTSATHQRPPEVR
jgi:uncharacterized membrane protein YphA (DoxX/SURF4 family)